METHRKHEKEIRISVVVTPTIRAALKSLSKNGAMSEAAVCRLALTTVFGTEEQQVTAKRLLTALGADSLPDTQANQTAPLSSRE